MTSKAANSCHVHKQEAYGDDVCCVSLSYTMILPIQTMLLQNTIVL